jgi:hypothetical protein
MKKATFLFVIGVLTAVLLSTAQPVKTAEMDDRQAASL